MIAGDETIDPAETHLAVPLLDEVLFAVVLRRVDSRRQDGMTETETFEETEITGTTTEVAYDLPGVEEALNIQGYSHQPNTPTPTQSP